MKIFELILPFAMKLIHSWLERNEDVKEAKKDWMNFINKMDQEKSNSKRVSNTIRKLKSNWLA
tara:strand:- start:593 stop:781 length:189 start_codon:yes stop_codon:yes gene_type:complete